MDGPAEGERAPAAGAVSNRIDGETVVNGGVVQTGTFTGQIHFHYRDHRAPVDLASLRLWVDRITADYRALVERDGGRSRAGHLKRAETLRRTLHDSPEANDGRNTVRRLLVAGLTRYLAQTQDLPHAPLPDQILMDLVVFCLWPVVTARRLPEGWQGELAEITSPRLAALVEHARTTARPARRSGDEAVAEAFARALANNDKSFADAMVTLFDDLGDPRRGGALLTSMAVVGGLPQPPAGPAKKVFPWVVGLVGGAVAVDVAVDHGPGLVHLMESSMDELPGDAIDPSEWIVAFLEGIFS